MIGLLLVTVGMTFVLTSYNKLGFYGTYMGDHFGIYLDSRITSFPFNVVDNPMYIGSVTNILGYALLIRSHIVAMFAVLALVVYFSFVNFHEEKFTAYIYKQKADREKSQQKN